METILWKLEQNYKEELERRKKIAMYHKINVKQLLDLGFNNNYIKKSNGKKVCIGWKDENGEYWYDLTEEQLNVKVYMEKDFGYYDDEDTDGDGYHIAVVKCLNSEDEKLFEEV